MVTVLRRGGLLGAAIFIVSMATPALVLAHGGMGPNEVGPPFATAGLLGFVGYWVVMLWPSSKKKSDQTIDINGQSSLTSRTGVRSHARSVRVKRAPRLRKIEGRGQFGGDQNTRRKVSDG